MPSCAASFSGLRAERPLDHRHADSDAVRDLFEDAVVGIDLEQAEEVIDFLDRDLLVVNHVAVGLQIKRVEDVPPPVGADVFFQVGNRA